MESVSYGPLWSALSWTAMEYMVYEPQWNAWSWTALLFVVPALKLVVTDRSVYLSWS